MLGPIGVCYFNLNREAVRVRLREQNDTYTRLFHI
jgi:hypothetical protein